MTSKNIRYYSTSLTVLKTKSPKKLKKDVATLFDVGKFNLKGATLECIF